MSTFLPHPIGRKRLRVSGAAAICLTVALATSGCSSSGGSSPRDDLLTLPVPATQTIGTGAISGLGTVLVDGRGRTLYMFPPDAGSRVSCTGTCAGTWPPVVIQDGKRPTAGPGVHTQLLSTIADPNSGARIVTYAGYPLYRYAGDITRGTASGQSLFNSGGPWYVLSPVGNPITATPNVQR